MKNSNKKFGFLTWLSLVAIVLVALFSVQYGSKFSLGSFTEQEDFQMQMADFYERLGEVVLNPIDIEAENEQIPVLKAEIEEHRNRYGTLSEQIQSINEQYKDRIAEAEAEKNEIVKTALVQERDAKINDIRKNFEDDAHVEAKIRAGKLQHVKQYVQQRQHDFNNLLEFPVAYELTDIETGKTFTKGNMKESSGYQKDFNAENGYLVASQYNRSDLYDIYPEYGVDYNAAMDHVSENYLRSDVNTSKRFQGTVMIPANAFESGWLGRQVDSFNRTKYGMIALWAAGILAAIALFTFSRFQKEWITNSSYADRYMRLKIDVKVALLLLAILITGIILEAIQHDFHWYVSSNGIESLFSLVFTFALLVVFLWAMVFQVLLFVKRLKATGALEQDIKESLTIKFFKIWRDMFLNRKVGTFMFILLIGFFLAGIGFVGSMVANQLFLIYIPLVLFVGLPFLFLFVSQTAYLNRIMVATKEMAEGRLNEEIPAKGKSPLADHAKNLNNLREGVRVSMTEQAKSERLKTELITNVSHDLRTPLTSIITYTDLLKNEELTAEERSKYVDVLDKKSQRLKTLIEDLFEVSKMASGNLELHKQRVDLTQLLQQALAEHEEEISISGIDFRVSLPDEGLVAYVDGQKWWRVLDNLIINAIKYTLPGTRVYMTLRKIGNSAEFVVKNVTKYELGENTDELFERFKRGDASRHTDGSGLGLAIAQSIVDLHNGQLKIDVDGDLFKVTVTVPAL